LTYAALGELSLDGAVKSGVLFLDELPEFRKMFWRDFANRWNMEQLQSPSHPRWHHFSPV
jgi:predicted ATPase with chaperone activity